MGGDGHGLLHSDRFAPPPSHLRQMRRVSDRRREDLFSELRRRDEADSDARTSADAEINRSLRDWYGEPSAQLDALVDACLRIGARTLTHMHALLERWVTRPLASTLPTRDPTLRPIPCARADTHP